MSVFDVVKNYEIIVHNYDILSAFMKFIFTLNLVFMKLSSFIKSLQEIRSVHLSFSN